MTAVDWFGLGFLVASLLFGIFVITSDDKTADENRRLLRLLSEAYDDLNKAERDAYGND